jgi:hypothetical protein
MPKDPSRDEEKFRSGRYSPLPPPHAPSSVRPSTPAHSYILPPLEYRNQDPVRNSNAALGLSTNYAIRNHQPYIVQPPAPMLPPMIIAPQDTFHQYPIDYPAAVSPDSCENILLLIPKQILDEDHWQQQSLQRYQSATRQSATPFNHPSSWSSVQSVSQQMLPEQNSFTMRDNFFHAGRDIHISNINAGASRETPNMVSSAFRTTTLTLC